MVSLHRYVRRTLSTVVDASLGPSLGVRYGIPYGYVQCYIDFRNVRVDR